MAEVVFKTSSGGDPVQYVIHLGASLNPTEGDVLYAAQRQRTRIVERTLRGVDANGLPFEPYDTSTPYYYYPNGRAGRTKATAKQNKAAVSRLLPKLNKGAENRYLALLAAGRDEEAERASVGGVKTRDGQGIRFESYADFKRSLGRAGVDLTGPRAPHMLQAIEVRVQGTSYGVQDVSNQSKRPVTEFALGIYGEAAGRATGHNTGFNPRWNRRHQRYFFGASAQDLLDMVSDVWTRIKARMGRA